MKQVNSMWKVQEGSKILWKVKEPKGILTFKTKREAVKWVEATRKGI